MKKLIIAILIVLVLLSAAVIVDGGFRFSNREKSTSAAKLTTIENEAKNENLSSFFNNKNDYDSAFSRAANIYKKNVLAGIISHHYLAKDLIARFFSGISNRDIDNIILVGPDHYNALDYPLDNIKPDAVTTKLSWDTPYGELDPNKEFPDKILAGNNIVENDSVFKTDHSIYTLIPFIKKVFPKAKIIPLVVRNNNDYEKFIRMGESIRKNVGDRSLLVVSSDFSHNASIAEAGKNDQASIEILNSLSQKNIDGITSDCSSCIAVLYGFLKKDPNGFYLNENKNSSDFGSQDKTVTSYVSAYYLR